jgi:hypothetical protein
MTSVRAVACGDSTAAPGDQSQAAPVAIEPPPTRAAYRSHSIRSLAPAATRWVYLGHGASVVALAVAATALIGCGGDGPIPPPPPPVGSATACTELLKGGVFNSIITSSSSTLEENLTQWLKVTTYEEFSSKQAGGLKLVIAGYPQNGSWDQQTFRKFQSELNSGTISSITATQASQTVQLSASPEILNAYLACLRSVNGLVASHVINGADIIFVIRYIPIAGQDRAVVSPGGFKVTGATVVGEGFASGENVPSVGKAVLLRWTDTLVAATFVLNTDRGNVVETVPSKSRTPAAPVPPALVLRTFQMLTPSAVVLAQGRLAVPVGWKILSCGARVNYGGPGQLLTDVHPEDDQTCVAAAKAHGTADPATLDMFSVAVSDPKNEWDVVVRSATSAPAGAPCQTVQLPEGYALTGGGAFDHWSTVGGLLTASRPYGTAGWMACAKQHEVTEATSITAYAIGIRPRSSLAAPEVQIFVATGTQSDTPSAKVGVGAGFTLVGGGAEDNWRGFGNLLTASFPDGGGWAAQGKAHSRSDPSTVTVYAIGIRWPR